MTHWVGSQCLWEWTCIRWTPRKAAACFCTSKWSSLGSFLAVLQLKCALSCRDKSVPVRELSTEERRSLTNKEKARLDRLGCISTTRYSQRRERALKIYLDSPEKPSNVTASAPIDAHENWLAALSSLSLLLFPRRTTLVLQLKHHWLNPRVRRLFWLPTFSSFGVRRALVLMINHDL